MNTTVNLTAGGWRGFSLGTNFTNAPDGHYIVQNTASDTLTVDGESLRENGFTYRDVLDRMEKAEAQLETLKLRLANWEERMTAMEYAPPPEGGPKYKTLPQDWQELALRVGAELTI
jgi:hypothetical protein